MASLEEIAQCGKNISIFQPEMHSEFPQDFSEKLPNLQVLHLASVDDNANCLPQSLSSLHQLKVIHVENRNALHHLPADIGACEKLTVMSISKTSIKQIPESFAENTTLKKANLPQNLLCRVPTEFCQLLSLEELNLSLNPISELPDVFGMLKNLVHLKLNG
jgi:Leucine-rich repeat (LRR) protein